MIYDQPKHSETKTTEKLENPEVTNNFSGNNNTSVYNFNIENLRKQKG